MSTSSSTYGYIAVLYVAVTIVLLYVFNLSREAVPTERVITVLTIFWMFVVVWGALGVVFPTLNFTSPMEKVMPQRLVGNEFVHDLVHPALSQVQDILGYDEPRPKAPFTYATNWGAAFGVLTPFVVLAWKQARKRGWKMLIAAVFVVGIVPVVSSLDRGLWLSLGNRDDVRSGSTGHRGEQPRASHQPTVDRHRDRWWSSSRH